MNICSKHPTIVFLEPDCPVCELKRQLEEKDSQINKLLKFRMSVSDDKVLNMDLIAKVTGLKKSSLYQYNYTHEGNAKMPFSKNGRAIIIKLSKLKQWAELNNKVLDLTKISIL